MQFRNNSVGLVAWAESQTIAGSGAYRQCRGDRYSIYQTAMDWWLLADLALIKSVF